MNRIRKIREARKLSQKELATLANVSAPYLCDLEKNRRGATPETYQRIADALNVDVSELVEKAG